MKKRRRGNLRRSVLQTIEVCASVFFFRAAELKGEPFRKATEYEKRKWFFFFALIPAIAIGIVRRIGVIPKSIENSPYYGFLIWLGFVLVVGVVVLGGVTFAQKLSIFVTVPLAIVFWLVLAWFVWIRFL